MAEHLTLVAYSPERPFDKLKCVEHKNKAGREVFATGSRKLLLRLVTKSYPLHAAEAPSDRVLDNRRNRSNSNNDGNKRS